MKFWALALRRHFPITLRRWRLSTCLIYSHVFYFLNQQRYSFLETKPAWTIKWRNEQIEATATFSWFFPSGKSYIGGTKALENRHFIKHLISACPSSSLANDLKIAVSRILGEMKPRADMYRSRTKRLVIKRQTEETKYSLKESILRSKVKRDVRDI